MAITLTEAREIIADHRGPLYGPDKQFLVAEFGWENDEMYVIKSGTPAEVFGPKSVADMRDIQLNAPVTAVMKATGEYREFYRLQGELPAPDLVRFGTRP